MIEDKCDIDDQGNCKTHGPGTEGEAVLANRVVDASADVVRQGMAKIYASWKLLDIMSPAFTNYVAEKPGAIVPEIEIHKILQRVLDAGLQAVQEITALRAISPNAS